MDENNIFREGIFIYPTDTIYGLGCNALDEKLVNKLREIKNRDEKPLSIIAPSEKWILDNFDIDENFVKKYLPGPYTLLLKKKNKDFLKWISNNDLIGVRIPDCNFTKEIQRVGIPIVTTSVNFSGEPFSTSLEEIDPRIKNKVDFIFLSKEKLSGKPSVIVKGNELIERV